MIPTELLFPTPSARSVLSPPVAASHTLVETRHRFIRTPDLHLIERSLIPITSILRTLNLCLVGIVPSALPTKDVLPLLAHVRLTLEVLTLEQELVGAGLTFEAVNGVIFGSVGCR